MLELIEAKDNDGLLFFIGVRAAIVLACWLFIIMSNIIDFWSGTTTAKVLGQALMSHGFRHTITKIGDYVRVMLFALMFDVIGSLFSFYVAPFITILCTIAVMYIEGRSVVENSRRKKAHAADVPEIVRQIVHAATTEQGLEIVQRISEQLTLEKKGK